MSMALSLLALPRVTKRLVVLAIDTSLCLFTVWCAFCLRLDTFISLSGPVLLATLLAIVFALPVFIVSGFYRAIFRYAGWPALLTVCKAMLAYTLLYASTLTVIKIQGVPRTIGLIQPILLFLVICISRVLARFWLGGLYQYRLKPTSLPKVLIYGTGTTGQQLATAIRHSNKMRVIGFLDDDISLHNHILNGQPIYNPADLPQLVSVLDIHDVLLALPSISRKRRNEILNKIVDAKITVRTLPSVIELAQGKISISDLRELEIDDLLGREPIPPNPILLSKNITGKVVLITGAGGSIGSELCRQILKAKPNTLLLIEQSEFALYQIHQELHNQLGLLAVHTSKLVPLLASVCDEERMAEIFSTWKPDTTYHAAAYKHVPLVEHNPSEGIKNNVLGTLITAKVAAKQGVSDFVLISTDKAVRPTNVMGASKRLAEMVLQSLSSTTKTKFSMVRFGNVLGSSGSVVPKFRQQILNGGPITLTHPDITRYFMTLSEAAQLVIQAGAMAEGGDVFVLDMGQSIKIIDLAKRMVELTGLTIRDDNNPDGDIDIAITGLRPGEKLYEELLINEHFEPTSHPRIMKAHEDFLLWSVLEEKLNTLKIALDANDIGVVRLILKQLVTGYQPNSKIVDWVYMESEVRDQGTEVRSGSHASA